MSIALGGIPGQNIWIVLRVTAIDVRVAIADLLTHPRQRAPSWNLFARKRRLRRLSTGPLLFAPPILLE